MARIGSDALNSELAERYPYKAVSKIGRVVEAG
jgi:hypothetical protein